jgi:F0F1-type ATP synthase membrane subunit b/b'
MADFNIIPEPVTLALHTTIQAGVFLSTAYVINRFYVQPYLKVRRKRLAVTSGSHELATGILEDNKKRQDQIDLKVAEVLDSAKQSAAEIVKKAQEERQRLIGFAEQKSVGEMVKSKASIQTRFDQEKAKLAQSVSDISRLIVQKILG